ncbi:MAG: nucleotidyltransferase domain-containing protein [Thermoplasmatales archaeon]|nr:nucleotidyltransferase domain-containing protein [Thermoplasmatales archaeon]
MAQWRREKNTPLSDIDISVYYDDIREERFKFRIEVLGNISENVDIQIFQDLPIYIKKEVISKGNILY